MGWLDRPDVTPPDDVKSVAEESGNTSTYFGGIGSPDGPGHGHVAADEDGNVTYEREAGPDEQGTWHE